MAAVQLRLLGGFALIGSDERPLVVRPPRLRLLLAYLTLHCAAPLPRRQVGFNLWPDSTDAQAQTNLRHLLYILRHLLPAVGALIEDDGVHICWQPDSPLVIDVVVFERSLGEAETALRRADVAAARLALERAVAAYRGDLLPDCYDDWVLAERERLGQEQTHALQQLAELCEADRDYPAALAAAERLVHHDPLREESHLQLIRLYTLSGDRAAALHAYHACETTLQQELGIAPGPVLSELYARLVSNPGAASVPYPVGVSLVGRRHEWTRLLQIWRDARRRPKIVIVSGEAGIGKTRLAEELLI
jgi:DNA-binding SARP family transcriptional activator